MKRWLATMALVLGLLPMLFPSVVLGRAATRAVAGSVVTLRGTSHIWIADDDGVFHWVADTRALLGRPVSWSLRTELDEQHIRALPRGEPWLSAAPVLLDGAIYIPKWEDGNVLPELHRLDSPHDLDLFGIVPLIPLRPHTRPPAAPVPILSPEDWQRQHGFPIDLLTLR